MYLKEPTCLWISVVDGWLIPSAYSAPVGHVTQFICARNAIGSSSLPIKSGGMSAERAHVRAEWEGETRRGRHAHLGEGSQPTPPLQKIKTSGNKIIG